VSGICIQVLLSQARFRTTSQAQEYPLAQLTHQPYGMASSSYLSPQMVAPLMVLLLLCLSLIWQRRKRSCEARLQPSIAEDSIIQSSDVVSPWDRVRGKGPLLDDEEGIFTSPTPASAMLMNGACMTEVLQSSITSGQYAAMVQRRDEQKDTKNPSLHQAPYPWMSQASCSRFTPWSSAKIEENIKIENNSIDFYRGSEPQEVWRRRVLAFVGQ
jgi:hypothetical protein